MVRFKNRYLLCEIVFENENENTDSLVIDFRTLRKEIFSSINKNFGDLGSAKLSNMQIKYWNSLTNIFIVRGIREEKDILWNSLIFINSI
mmetsp:Transcript_16549/g.1481  ORF Transcript_16549/g.1481 Transcript_16549/m.1481 type:complete len:90 (+) Transcript_16549:50-319(+)